MNISGAGECCLCESLVLQRRALPSPGAVGLMPTGSLTGDLLRHCQFLHCLLCKRKASRPSLSFSFKFAARHISNFLFIWQVNSYRNGGLSNHRTVFLVQSVNKNWGQKVPLGNPWDFGRGLALQCHGTWRCRRVASDAQVCTV